MGEDVVDFEAVFELGPDAMFVTDTGGRIAHVNRQAAVLFGYERKDMVGQPVEFLMPERFRGAHVAKAADFRAHGHSRPMGTGLDIMARRRDGSEFPADIMLATLGAPADAQRGARVLAVIRDITARKKAEAELRETEANLRQAQKMEAIGRLAGGVAHDFNNMLTAILSYAALLKMGSELADSAQADLAQIVRAAERAAALTRQLLAFSRQQVLQPASVDANEIVRGVSNMLQRLIGEDVDLRLSLTPGIGKIFVDPGQLEQVLLNLVLNARDAMPKGGTVTIETSDTSLEGPLVAHHGVLQPGRYVVLAVSDTGIGMTAEVQARIFEPFFTTKERGRGTGLGLSTVYGILRQSGGDITVYSEVGHGTTFKVYLPRHDAEMTLASPHMPDDLTRLRGTETLLLAEDEALVREAATQILRGLGYHVLVAANAEQALEVCRSRDGRVDLLLTDLIMPGMSGRELADCIVATWPRVRALFMSGYTDDVIFHQRVLEAGVAFVPKPFTPSILARKVREVLDAPAKAVPVQ